MTGRYEGGCQCAICQKVIGAAFNARILFRQSDVAITGPVTTFASSEPLRRGFCGRCGGTIFSARDSVGVIGITTGSLDDPSLFRPAEHIWVSAKQPWVKLDDGLPQYDEAAPA
jgi:hypothetical protein